MLRHHGAEDEQQNGDWRTTLVVPVPEAEHVVGAWRDRYDRYAAEDVPAHITVLAPFLPPEEIGPAVLERLASLCSAWVPVRLSLADTAVLGNSVCLIPDPADPLREIASALRARWPQTGDVGERAYHVTVARHPPQPAEVERALRPRLPLATTCVELVLFERRYGRVRELGRFPFGSY